MEEPDLAVEEMYIRAFIGSKKCKNKFASYLGFYDMDEGIREVEEAAIASSMQVPWMRNSSWCISSLNLTLPMTGISGRKRWYAGSIPIQADAPKHFIPIFEKNGFISRLDYYVWEHVCRLIHKWLGDGICLDPITVNISRISLYNPRLQTYCQALLNSMTCPSAC